jgi:hypothetical protein
VRKAVRVFGMVVVLLTLLGGMALNVANFVITHSGKPLPNMSPGYYGTWWDTSVFSVVMILMLTCAIGCAITLATLRKTE